MNKLFSSLASLLFALQLSAQQPGPVVFSEIMWMGSTASSADEWVELYNRSAEPVELAGWTITRLTADGEQTMLTIEAGVLAPSRTFLIANYGPEHKNSQLAVQPQLVSSQLSLPNTRLQLRLYDALPEQGGQLIDTADDGTGAPLAGDNTLKRSMVRVRFDRDGAHPDSWATAQESSGWKEGAQELGTPGSLPTFLLPQGPKEEDSTSQSEPTPGLDRTPVSPVSWARVKGKVLP